MFVLLLLFSKCRVRRAPHVLIDRSFCVSFSLFVLRCCAVSFNALYFYIVFTVLRITSRRVYLLINLWYAKDCIISCFFCFFSVSALPMKVSEGSFVGWTVVVDLVVFLLLVCFASSSLSTIRSVYVCVCMCLRVCCCFVVTWVCYSRPRNFGMSFTHRLNPFWLYLFF